MVLHVAKGSFSDDVAHISFPTEVDKVRNEVIAVGWGRRNGKRAKNTSTRGRNTGRKRHCSTKRIQKIQFGRSKRHSKTY